MATDCIPQLTFDFHRQRREFVVRFDAEHGSSDGGALLLKAVDERLGLTAALAAALSDSREPGKVRHSLHDILRQRIFGLCCGYADANDSARLARDPIHKALLDRDPMSGDDLAAQPTISRFENAFGARDLVRMARALTDLVIETQRRRRGGRARRITIDLDPTDDRTHGHQQLSFFNGHYDAWCYLPMVGTIQFEGEAEQHLVCAILRPGNAGPSLGAVGILRRLIGRLRRAFPGATIRVRLDGGFAAPAIFDLLESKRVEYVVAIAKNAVLNKDAELLMGLVRARSEATGETETLFGETKYAAKTWKRARRVVMKAEVVRHPGREPRDNQRFVVTNLRLRPRSVYDVYRGRGDAENRIKELKLDLAMDRTSCSRFLANQLRVLLSAAAYVLYQELRWTARHTGCARAQVGTLRERLIKLGAWVQRSVRRVVVHLPASYPWLDTWRALAGALGARVT